MAPHISCRRGLSHRDPAEHHLTIARTQRTTDKGREPRGSLFEDHFSGIGVLIKGRAAEDHPIKPLAQGLHGCGWSVPLEDDLF